MYHFNKFPHPLNFRYPEAFGAKEELRLEAAGSKEGVFRVRILPGDSGAKPASGPSLDSAYQVRSELSPPQDFGESLSHPSSSLECRADGGIALLDEKGEPFLHSVRRKGFGLMGKNWIFQFVLEDDMQFYGLGEKSMAFERSNRTYRFFNSDAWADHSLSDVRDHVYDPDYISIPYLIVKRGNRYAGILLDNPYPSFVSISPKANIANQMASANALNDHVYLGAEGGLPSLYLLFGPSLAELTKKLQRLVGPSPLPPLWALGHHQCRWGYRGSFDLERLADGFEKAGVPNDGLWLDIDYMRGYRVFTYEKEHFRDVKDDVAALEKRGFKVVPIIDPGVKREAGYAVHDSGLEAGIFCRNPEGAPYVGLVWPGHTLFPDFTLEKGQAWWADQVKGFFDMGFAGAWLDMNEPATGQVDCSHMLFGEGREAHEAYHNQYAMLMAKASFRGSLAQNPNRRPFFLSRAGFTGSQKWAANWMGDNVSTYRHLHMTPGKAMSLALSGMPLVGGDVGGFGGNTTAPLLVDWYKAAFMLPFFRNHCHRGEHDQEPWAFGEEPLRLIRRFVRLRYKLLPYLYNLFIRHEETGEAVLRPLFHDFKDSEALPLSHVNDQFLMGPFWMQAPHTVEDAESREIILPEGRWFAAEKGEWVDGGLAYREKRAEESTPIFLREGALLPMQAGEIRSSAKDLRAVELHLFLPPAFAGKAVYEYALDDGESFEYRQGKRSRYRLEAERKGGEIVLTVTPLALGFGEAAFTPVTWDKTEKVKVITKAETGKVLSAKAEKSDLFGPVLEKRVWG